LAQARVGAAKRGAEVVRAAVEPRAERGDDQPEALLVRPAEDVVDEVRGDRRAGLVDRNGPAVPQLLRGLARLTVDEVLADQRLRLDVAGGVLAEVVEAGLRDLDGHDRLGRLAL